jgi:hypothetical protein
MNRLPKSVQQWLPGFAIGLVLLVLMPIIWPDKNYQLPKYWTALFFVVFFANGLVVVITESRIVRSAAIFAFGVLCANAIRIQIDWMHDPTDHNLLPFELLFEFVGLWLAAMAGGFFGWIAIRATARRAER